MEMSQFPRGLPTAAWLAIYDWGRSARIAHIGDVHGYGQLRAANRRWSPIMCEASMSPSKVLTRYLARIMGKHPAVQGGHRWCRPSVHAVITVPRPPGAEVVDALTSLVHRVSVDELLAGRRRGNYLALCGARFPAASMVDPGRGRCRDCAR